MKRLLTFFLTLALLPAFTLSAQKADEENHRLVKLWQEYNSAQSKDLPGTAAGVLESIKAEAKRQHLAWDYYDACDKYVQVRTWSNWKLRDSLMNAFRSEIEGFGEPAATYYMRRGEEDPVLLDYITENEKALRASKNEEFWQRDWRLNRYKFGSALRPLLAGDWDYCLWSLFPKERMQQEFTSYPLKAFVDFQLICQDNDKQAFAEYAARYQGKAAALLAEEEILRIKFEELQGKGGSDSFKELRSECEELIARGKAFKGGEKTIAECCNEAAGIIESLDSKMLNFEIEDSAINFELRNISSVNITVWNGKVKLWEFVQANPFNSYYATCKLQTRLPALADGTYTVKCVAGEQESEQEWEKYTISAVARWNEDGLGIWATDFISGRPFETADIEVAKNGKVLKDYKGLCINGFTTLPKDIQSYFGKDEAYNNRTTLTIRSGSRLSRKIAVGKYDSPDLTDNLAYRRCIVLTDRSAFRPDETVFFKAILYNGKYTLRTSGAGIKLRVELRDAMNKVLQESELTTNDFGSIAGSFMLRRTERNGYYSICIYNDNQALCTRTVLVDDFVLPTFDLTFDELPRLQLPMESVSVKGTIRAYSGHSLAGASISYKIFHNGEDWAAGNISPDKDRFVLAFPTDTTGTKYGQSFVLAVKVTDVTGETMEFQKHIYIAGHTEPRYKTYYYFEDSDEDIGVKIVAADKETWAISELYGTGNKLIDSKLLHFSPSGEEPANATVSYKYLQDYPKEICLKVIYFQNKDCFVHDARSSREDKTYEMPLRFERFLDTTAPGAEYSFIIKTGAGAEVAAAIFDKSTERFSGNVWRPAEPESYPSPSVRYRAVSGNDKSNSIYGYYGVKIRGAVSKAMLNTVRMADAAVEEEAITLQLEQQDSPVPDAPSIAIRENFARTVAWEPFLKASADGTVRFTFRNSQQLSTFNVQVFAHDKWMRNNALRREMMVTIPVKISMVEPQFLYKGDKWNVRIGLSSTLVGDVDGLLEVSFLNGNDYRTSPVISKVSRGVTLPGKGSASFDFAFEASHAGDLGIIATFKPVRVDEGADGVFVTVPVSEAAQTLTEAHSGVLLSGMDRTVLEKRLRCEFENSPGSEAMLKEVSILDMIREALPQSLDTSSEDAIALSEALYAAALCDSLGVKPAFDRAKTMSKLMELKGSDGGFAWMKGMNSSAIVTAVVLQRLRGLGIIDEEAAVHYIDKQYFTKDHTRWWHCGLSMEKYLYTRSLFPSVKFKESTTRDFRKAARDYLVPGKMRGLNGEIMPKARRLLTLKNFSEMEGGTALAHRMGIRLFAAKRIRNSITADVASLVQYAQKHKSGGMYYPNAVMPWRGLLESELYAHSLLCNLMAYYGHPGIADGIRLWIMLQKETQHWEKDPAYIEAIACVMNASQAVLDTRVLALSATYSKPFTAIKASGNGITISRKAVDSLKVGDRVRITWDLSNEENRSFVRIVLPHSAGLVPVNQTSGYGRGCYRSVLKDRTELWYESYPEEKTSVSEEYYVTRSGSFQCPAAVVECLYAPHYRANTAAPAVQVVL